MGALRVYRGKPIAFSVYQSNPPDASTGIVEGSKIAKKLTLLQDEADERDGDPRDEDAS